MTYTRGPEKIKKLILKNLKNKEEKMVQEIAAGIKISRVTVGKYLQILEAEGRVTHRKVATAHLYRIGGAHNAKEKR